MIRTFCDVCKKEIVGDNVGKNDYWVKSGQLQIIVIVRENEIVHDADLCLDCLLKMLNQKPKRRYVKKEKVEPDPALLKALQVIERVEVQPFAKPEQVSTLLVPAEVSPEPVLPSKGKGKKAPRNQAQKETPTPKEAPTSIYLPDISTFSVRIGQGDELSQLTMGGVAAISKTLSEGAMELLAVLAIDRKYVEESPESEGKRNLLDILDAGK